MESVREGVASAAVPPAHSEAPTAKPKPEGDASTQPPPPVQKVRGWSWDALHTPTDLHTHRYVCYVCYVYGVFGREVSMYAVIFRVYVALTNPACVKESV